MLYSNVSVAAKWMRRERCISIIARPSIAHHLAESPECQNDFLVIIDQWCSSLVMTLNEDAIDDEMNINSMPHFTVQ
jgi:hypothetical protein